MARGFVDRFLTFMGIQDEPMEPADPEPVPERVLSPNRTGAGGEGATRSIGVAEALTSTEVTVLRPKVFDDVQLVAGILKGRRPVVVSLEGCERPAAQRMIDFLSGATFALDGHMRRIGEDIFLFTPSHITIEEQDEEEQDEASQGNGD